MTIMNGMNDNISESVWVCLSQALPCYKLKLEILTDWLLAKKKA